MLVVDDEPWALKGHLEALTSSGARVDVLETGEAALETLASRSYDVIILDLVLPGLSGEEVLAQLRRESIPIRVIVLTGYGAWADTAGEAQRLGADHYQVKSLPPRLLVLAVLATMSSRFARVDRDSLGQPTLHGDGAVVSRQSQPTDALLRSLRRLMVQGTAGPVTTSSARRQILEGLIRAFIEPSISVPLAWTLAQAFKEISERGDLRARVDDILARIDRASRFDGNAVGAEVRAIILDCERPATRHDAGTPSEAARAADDACRKQFHLETGISRHHWRWVSRIRPVARGLARNRQPVSQLAYDAGYEDLSQMNRDFHSVLGLTPTEVRALCRDFGTAGGQEELP